MSQQHRWLSPSNRTLLSLLSLGLLLIVAACGGDSGNYKTTQTNNSGGIGVNGDAKFSGNIIFVKKRNMFILHGKDGSLTQLTSDGTTLQPAISPDNSTIAFEVRKSGNDYSDIATMPVTGGAITMRTDDSLHDKSTGRPYHYLFWANNPIWTGDGQNLIYTTDFFKGGKTTRYSNQTCPGISDGPNSSYILDMGIAEMPANAQAAPALDQPPTLLAWPYCLAGGDQDLSLRPGVADTEVLFTSFQYAGAKNDLISQLSLLIIPASGQEQVIQLSPQDPNALPLQASWSPDGKSITYIRREKGQDNLYVMSVPDTITGTPNDESYIISQHGATKRSVYYTNTDYYAASQKLADGIVGNPIWINGHQLVYMQLMQLDNGNQEFDLFLANLKFSTPAASTTPTASPTGAAATGTPGAASAPGIAIDGKPIQLTQGGVDGESRPVWFP
ncbi:MAG TPA: hypothetical protein VH540_05325 [Ktedonobacterales bacterium]